MATDLGPQPYLIASVISPTGVSDIQVTGTISMDAFGCTKLSSIVITDSDTSFVLAQHDNLAGTVDDTNGTDIDITWFFDGVSGTPGVNWDITIVNNCDTVDMWSANIPAAEITDVQGFGQAQAVIKRLHNGIGQAQAKIKSFNAGKSGQANADIRTFANKGFGQAQGLRADRTHGSAQAAAQIIAAENSTAGIAQWVSKGPLPKYLAKYNNYRLPGYVQNETFDNGQRVVQHQSVYADGSLSEYTGLNNKNMTVAFKVWEQDYLACKSEVAKAATILRSKRSGYSALYLQYSDRHYDALAKAIRIQKTADGASVRTLEYQVDFEARPWLIEDATHTLTGPGLISTDQVGRTFVDGTWAPTQILVTGTDITISGHTDTGLYAGYASISGSVSNLLIDSENFTATVAGTNVNDQMVWPDYRLYVGPGRTFFDVYGATSMTVTYNNRWPL